MNRRNFMSAYIAFYLVVVLLTGCASPNKQMVPVASGTIPANSARITVLRDKQITARVNIVDNGKPIGTIAPGGQLVWDRIAGSMQLIAYHANIPSDAGKVKPLNVCVGAGMSYQFRVYFPAMQRYSLPNIELVSGAPVVCEQSVTNTIVGKAEFAQPPSTITGEAKIFIGKVEKITQTIRRTSEGPYCKILVVADNGENYTFFVFGTTSVTDSAGKDMTEGGSKCMLLTKGERIEVRYSTITNGSIITNGQNGATSIRRVPLDYVQRPTVAQTTLKTTEELQTFTGEVKIIEVRHFTQVDGLSLSQEFVNSFYDNMRERLAKGNVAGQIIGEGSATSPDLAVNTIIIEGKFTEYKKGGFLEGVGMVGSEIKLYRKSDHALIKIITPRVTFKPSPLNSDNGLGRSTGYRTADEIKKALK